MAQEHGAKTLLLSGALQGDLDSFFDIFGLVDILTKGGPQDATNVMIYNLYRDAFEYYKTGLASAQSVILFLLVVIIFIVSYLRTHFNTEYVRAHLQGKSELYGNVLAALFGIITPFCSCSAIPLFLGFLQARIPLGVTFSYLISAPMNNEIAIALLFGLFGVQM